MLINLKKELLKYKKAYFKLSLPLKIFYFIIFLILILPNLLSIFQEDSEFRKMYRGFLGYVERMMTPGSIDRKVFILIGTYVLATIFITTPKLMDKLLRRPVSRKSMILLFVPLCILAFIQIIPFEIWKEIYLYYKQ